MNGETYHGITYPPECAHSSPPCPGCECWSQFHPTKGSLRGSPDLTMDAQQIQLAILRELREIKILLDNRRPGD